MMKVLSPTHFPKSDQIYFGGWTSSLAEHFSALLILTRKNFSKYDKKTISHRYMIFVKTL